MSEIRFFHELACQLCKICYNSASLFCLADCTHWVCEECIPTLNLLKKCQISNCGKTLIKSETERINSNEFVKRLRLTYQNIAFCDSETIYKMNFNRFSISPISPVFITIETMIEINTTNVYINFHDFICSVKTSFGRIKENYFEFKDRLRVHNLMIRRVLQLESTLKSKMEELENLKIKDFFQNIDSFFVDGNLFIHVIFSRFLKLVETLLENALQRQFIFSSDTKTLSRIFQLIRENDYEVEPIDDERIMLTKFDPQLSEKNRIFGDLIPWSTSNEETEQVIETFDFYKSQNDQLQKMINRQKLPAINFKQMKQIRRRLQMNTLLQFRKNCEFIKKSTPESSIIKNRSVGFLACLFPKITKWLQLVHLKSDVDSERMLVDKCANLKYLLILMKSGPIIVGAIPRENSTNRTSMDYLQNTFLFSVDKRRKYFHEMKQIYSKTFSCSESLLQFENCGLTIQPRFQSKVNEYDVSSMS